MTEPDIFVGVDRGSRTHRVCIVDSAGRARGERAFEHGGRELAELADWILEAAPPDRAAVAIEVPHGPALESPMARQLAAHSIDPKQLDRFRDRISPAGAKDDRRDARVLADALRTDRRHFRRLDAEDPEIVALRAHSHRRGPRQKAQPPRHPTAPPVATPTRSAGTARRISAR